MYKSFTVMMQWRCGPGAPMKDVRSIRQTGNSEVICQVWEEQLNPKSSMSPLISDNVSYRES